MGKTEMKSKFCIKWIMFQKFLKGSFKYLIYTRTQNTVPLLVPFECKYWPFVLPQGAGQISCRKQTTCKVSIAVF